jgi:hypothetical protein
MIITDLLRPLQYIDATCTFSQFHDSGSQITKNYRQLKRERAPHRDALIVCSRAYAALAFFLRSAHRFFIICEIRRLASALM